jgi:hypothetical protein
VADLNLDDLRPPGRSIIFGGKEYFLPGEVPILTVMGGISVKRRYRESLKALREAIESGEDEAIEAAEDEQAQALSDFYEIAISLLRDVDPTVPDLRFTLTEVDRIIGLIASTGAESTDAGVAQALVGGEDGESESPPTQEKKERKMAVPSAKVKASSKAKPSSKSKQPSPAPSSA